MIMLLKLLLSGSVLLTLIQCTNPSNVDSSVDDTSIEDDSLSADTTLVIDSTKAKIQKDTVFLHRSLEEGIYHAVYIETNRQSIFHEALANFTFDKYDSTCNAETYDFFTEYNDHPNSFIKGNPLSNNYVPLFEYEEEYYVYAPSDWGAARKKIITDSTFMFWYMDGVSPYLLESVSTINENTFELTYLAFASNSLHESIINIYLIDKEKSVFLFDYTNQASDNRYQLYTIDSSVHLFDAIVNYSPMQKQHEYDFDPPTIKITKGQ